MPTTIELYERLTHQYADGWRDLDDERYLGTVKMLSLRLTRDDGIDGNTHLTRVIAPTDLSAVDLTHAIEDTLSGSRCRHEHDCCGCPSTYADARRISAREYAVKISTFYNV